MNKLCAYCHEKAEVVISSGNEQLIYCKKCFFEHPHMEKYIEKQEEIIRNNSKRILNVIDEIMA